MSVLFAAPRAHVAESDEEDEVPPLPQHAPVISLRPKNTVVGFTDE